MKSALRALLTERIDYAGLFPPAGLPMEEAVANYAAYRTAADAWALARFVLPVARMKEFEAAAAPLFSGAAWRVAVLAQASDADAIRAFNARMRGHAHIDTVESRALTADDVETLASLKSLATVYVELSVRDNTELPLQALAALGLRAKVRTGGVTADSIPSPHEVARFLVRCAKYRVPLKATAGLHHPLRGDYPLTYEAGSPRATMFGFLNIFLAASLARRGVPSDELAALLDERSIGAFRIDDNGVSWHEYILTTSDLHTDRTEFAGSFGSCSFREPLDDLSAITPP
jgi:hypothetical protein